MKLTRKQNKLNSIMKELSDVRDKLHAETQKSLEEKIDDPMNRIEPNQVIIIVQKIFLTNKFNDFLITYAFTYRNF